MDSYSPNALNFQNRKQKGLVKMFGGISCPFYFTNDVVKEGTPMRLITANIDQMTFCSQGQTHGAKCIGLALQETYDESVMGQLKGYHFANDTRQRLNGNPIGVLTGKGWAFTTNYFGTVANGQQAAIGPSGYLIDGTSAASGDKLPVYFEGTGGTNNSNVLAATSPVRIRFDFPVNVAPSAS